MIGAINLRLIVLPPCAIQSVLLVCAADSGAFQRRKANHPPIKMSIVPQKPGHHTGIPEFVTSA